MATTPARGARGTRQRRLTIAQAAAHRERLAFQSLDTAPRGRGSRAARRARALKHPGLSRTGKVVSKAQQRLFWADPALRKYAHRVSKRGAAFRALPERKHAPGVRSAL